MPLKLMHYRVAGPDSEVRIVWRRRRCYRVNQFSSRVAAARTNSTSDVDPA
jgi:hypothetical protein